MEKVNNDLTQKYSKATRIIHWLSFIGILILIQSGLIKAFKTRDYTLMPEHIELTATSVHWFAAMVLIFFIVLHVLGVIKHYLFTKENTIKRIL